MVFQVLPASRLPDPALAPALKWGILAPGFIAHAFAGALRAHTRDAARSIFREHRFGELRAGFAADIAITERDLFGVEAVAKPAKPPRPVVASRTRAAAAGGRRDDDGQMDLF